MDLLDSSIEDQFFRNPSDLYAIVKALPKEIIYVVINEIQKVPKLLDEVHRLIEETDKIFILTGSSARKLKRGGANLLAGRAFVYHLHALSCFEIKSSDAINEKDISAFSKITKDIENCEAIVLSQDRFTKKFDHVTCYPWKKGIAECFPEVKFAEF